MLIIHHFEETYGRLCQNDSFVRVGMLIEKEQSESMPSRRRGSGHTGPHSTLSSTSNQPNTTMNGLIRFTPNNNLRDIQRGIDRVFDDFFRPFGEERTSLWNPRVDFSETDDAYLIHADIPGVKKEDIDIDVQDSLPRTGSGGTLSISGERHQESAETDKKHNVLRAERAVGRFYRSFSLPSTVDVDAIEAKVEDGVLNVRVPKAKEVKPRKIEVA